MNKGLFAVTVGLPVVGMPACRSPAATPPPRHLPLSFEANRGQADSRVDYLARGAGHAVFLTPREAVVVLSKPDSMGVVLRMTFVDANPRPRVAGLEELPGKANYIVGQDPARWRTNVPLYAKVQYSRLYPGIDLRYSGDQSEMAYEVVVHPGADPKRITLDWQGADSLEPDPQGDLVLHTAVGLVSLRKPVISQELSGTRREIAGGYVEKAANQVGFEVAAYDAERPLVITGVVPLSITPIMR